MYLTDTIVVDKNISVWLAKQISSARRTQSDLQNFLTFYYLTAESSSDSAGALISQLTWCSGSNIKLLWAFRSNAFQSLCGLYWQDFVYNNPPLSTMLVLSLRYLLHLSRDSGLHRLILMLLINVSFSASQFWSKGSLTFCLQQLIDL